MINIDSEYVEARRVNSPFVDPWVFSLLRHGEPFVSGKALNTKTIECCGEKYTLVHPEEITFQPGQEIYIRIKGSRNFWVETPEEYEQRNLEILRTKYLQASVEDMPTDARHTLLAQRAYEVLREQDVDHLERLSDEQLLGLIDLFAKRQ